MKFLSVCLSELSVCLTIHLSICLIFPDIRTTPHEDKSPPYRFGPDEWFYSVVVGLVGSCPGGE